MVFYKIDINQHPAYGFLGIMLQEKKITSCE